MLGKNELALYGGSPVIGGPLEDYQPLDHTDNLAVELVMKSGILSDFIGASGKKFLGGARVREFEKSFANEFNVKHAISVNSLTSGLWCAIGSLNLEPGDEVITSTWTMAATATTILHWNLIPVFADIDPDTFNLDIADVENKIGKRTRAIVSPDIFGQSADIESLLLLCNKYNLYLVSDSAQAPGSRRNGYLTGTKSHIGGFSFNYHKHIHTGEGGMIVTDDDRLADRVRLLRNHGEVVIGSSPALSNETGILGMNMRLGEIESAIGVNQLRKLDSAIRSRREGAEYLESLISTLPDLSAPVVSNGNSHVYYVFGMKLNLKSLGVSRNTLVRALTAEGVPGLFEGYQNIHKLPLYSRHLTHKKSNFPYSLLTKRRRNELLSLQLPIAEVLHNETFFGINWCSKAFHKKDVELVAEAFHKVWDNIDSLLSGPKP